MGELISNPAAAMLDFFAKAAAAIGELVSNLKAGHERCGRVGGACLHPSQVPHIMQGN